MGSFEKLRANINITLAASENDKQEEINTVILEFVNLHEGGRLNINIRYHYSQSVRLQLLGDYADSILHFVDAWLCFGEAGSKVLQQL